MFWSGMDISYGMHHTVLVNRGANTCGGGMSPTNTSVQRVLKKSFLRGWHPAYVVLSYCYLIRTLLAR